MTLDEYQKKAITTDVFAAKKKLESASDPAFVAKILGLAGESGEVAEKFKKIIRDHAGKITAEDKKEITKELGDVLWYVSALAYYLEVPLQNVADKNLEKLFSRKARGVTKGSGDNR